MQGVQYRILVSLLCYNSSECTESLVYCLYVHLNMENKFIVNMIILICSSAIHLIYQDDQIILLSHEYNLSYFPHLRGLH